MSDVITRLRLDSGEFDSKVKRASAALNAMERECKKVAGTMDVLDKEQKDYVSSIGKMQTVSSTARGRIKELSDAFTDLSMRYRRMSDEAKKGDYGKAISKSMGDLKVRIQEAKGELKDIERDMNGGASATGGMSDALSALSGKLGINSDLMGLMTNGTMGYAAAIGLATSATLAAAKAWAEYNTQLAKQSQIVSVTTGAGGMEANELGDAARSIAEVYDVDFREVINAANTLMTQFGKSGSESIQLIRDGMQGMIQGDGGKLLTMIQQYAPAFRDAGISASQLVAIIHNSEGGIFTDQNMNAIVMGIKNIRLMTKATGDALAKVGIDGEKMTKQLNEGSITIFDAMKQVLEATKKVGSSSQAAGEVLQYVFGRQGVSAGTNLSKAITELNLNLEETKTQTGNVGESMAQLEQANERLNAAMRETFGTKDWQEAANFIKSVFVGAMASALSATNNLRESIYEVTKVDVFSTIIGGALNALGPLGKVANLLREIAGYGNMGKGSLNSGGQTGAKVGDIIKSNKSETSDASVTPVTTTTTKTKSSSSKNKWALIPMQEVGMVGIGRSIDDVNKDISRSQKQYNSALTEFDRLEALNSLEGYQKELAAMKGGGAFANAYGYDFQKDIDRNAKSMEKDDKEEKKNDKSVAEGVGQMVGGIQNMVGSLEQLGVTLPEGMGQLLNGIMAVVSLMQAVTTILTAIQAISAADTVIPFARGGMVRAAQGVFVPGNSMSGDRVPALLNSGEVVFNRAQQGNLVSQMRDSRYDSMMEMQPYVDGEKVLLGVNNYLRRSGRGEIVTSKRG